MASVSDEFPEMVAQIKFSQLSEAHVLAVSQYQRALLVSYHQPQYTESQARALLLLVWWGANTRMKTFLIRNAILFIDFLRSYVVWSSPFLLLPSLFFISLIQRHVMLPSFSSVFCCLLLKTGMSSPNRFRGCVMANVRRRAANFRQK